MKTDIQPVLAMYPSLFNAQTMPLGGAGGFSGALIWKLHADSQDYCLRRWPTEHPTAKHLTWIHNVLQHVHSAGQAYIPVPIANGAGQTFCDYGGHLWEVSHWMPGRADYRETLDCDTRITKLANAMTALALWHKSAETFQATGPQCPAPGIDMRRQRYQEFRQGGLDILRQHVAENRGFLPSNITTSANEILRQFSRSADLTGELQKACQIPVMLQPSIRDIWHDHVLFTGNHVSGIVDFGAMRMATIAGDVARLLGSLAVDDRQLWESGLQAYQVAIPPLDVGAAVTLRQLIRTWDAANVVLSGLQWVQWLFIEGRTFSSYGTVQQRMNELLVRLQYRILHGFP